MKKNLKDLTLTLFFTAGMGLKSWSETGNLQRELELYQNLSRHLNKINLLTYGGESDRDYLHTLGNLNLMPADWHSRQQLTALNIILKYFPRLLDTDIMKTNQIRGAWIPVWLKKIFRKKLIVRCGFLHSFFTSKQTDDEMRIREAVNLERTAFSAADLAVVTSAWQRDMVLNDYGLHPDKVKIVPNYVLTDIFKPNPEIGKEEDLIFIGRGDRQKNLFGLLKALKQLKESGEDYSLMMVGNCCDNSEIKDFIRNNRLPVKFKNNVANYNLPDLINQARIFILPSFYEGHPKALLEAMSCGAACIGADSAGVREEITHQETGFLCGTDEKSIAGAISDLMADEEMRRKIGLKAREYILKNYTLDKILQLELEAIEWVCKR